MAAGDHFDELETRDPAAREAAQFAALRAQIVQLKAAAGGWADRLAEVDAEAVADRAALAGLPLTRKHELIELQKATPPFGGLNVVAPGMAGRVFTSPGPIFEMEARESDYGRMARGLFAAGFRTGELVHNCFAYHLTPGGWIMDWGARALGCAVVPAGVGNTEQQVQAIAHLKPAGWCGTPDYLKVLLDKAAELGLDCGSISKAMVSGGALFPSLRQEYAERGVAVLQCYATAELGLVAYETAGPDGPHPGMVVDEGVIVEIVRPGTADPVPEGEVGEVVVTTFNPAYPMIRLATGDLSAVLPEPSPCGRTNMRIKGWMGRADQTTKIKGMFVHPEQVAATVARHPQVAKARLVVDRKGEADRMTLRCEVTSSYEGLQDALAETLQSVCKLKGEVELLHPGELPNDGKVIEDARSYE
jgi:phenylacetate-CoA ligase